MKAKNSIEYPISINIFDADNQVSNPIIVQGISQLFNFIEAISNEAIVYPILIKDSEGIYTVIRNSKQLESIVDRALIIEMQSQATQFQQNNNNTKY